MCKERWNSVEGSSYECWIMVLYNLYKKQGILGVCFSLSFHFRPSRLVSEFGCWECHLPASELGCLCLCFL